MAHASQRSLSVESFKVMDVLRKANQLQAEGKHVLHCEVGQPETGAPKTVAQAAVAALTEPQVMGYTDAFGLLPLREKIRNHYSKKYNLQTEIPTSRIVVTTGSSGAFLLAFTSCFDTGDIVAIASSGYPCYRNILSALGCHQANIPINQEFKLTAKELHNEIVRRKAANLKPINGLILSSPSNPTGAMLSPDELKDLCALCDEQGIQFLSDEIYHGISYGQTEATALQYSQNALIINSFSKYYSMSGWRLGWMVIPEELVEPINSLQQNMFINAPTISQTAALKCWDGDTIEELEKHVTKYRTSRQLILDQLASIAEIDDTNIAPADGGFYIYVDLGKENVAPGLGSVKMCDLLLQEKYVAMTPGTDFEDPDSSLGDRRFRISYAGGIETVRQAMQRFHEFFPTWVERVKKAKGEKKTKE
ncbi:Bifunctional aspartate aminotransferase and glutamate/aspartate-prephenate aminotransferase [Seminavis robusta]|uniref:Bifunctional aspartate aminotransferase and glutamate/aspartate-prephenate aminotransferase n=1 Tax=Seminavis robusta TaxID=568900 RepID=A0A9N8EVQ3_9STRA|nr:Bifunctional aspartate aminotransferase and glutamate/aspartate-prephenate aminotransferase [Seminavis robusta]|eukprot:Sro2152_g316750.1 Bifunctional aspartate aminotransferase and glutamate/aspartate-prephenate aminotransferase (421) ;mRNA; f:8111-9482